MPHSHLKALEDRCRELEEKIRAERHHPAHDDIVIQKLKKEKLALEEKIAKEKKTGT